MKFATGRGWNVMELNDVKSFWEMSGCYYCIVREGISTKNKFEFGFTSHDATENYIDFLPEADVKPGDTLSHPGKGEFQVVSTELQTYGVNEIPYQIRAHCKMQFRVVDTEGNSVGLNIQDSRPVYRVSSLEHPNQLIGVVDPVESTKVCVYMILLTPKGSAPMYREFGISWDALEYPPSVAKAMMVAEIKAAVERWEPRAHVIGLCFAENIQDPNKPAPGPAQAVEHVV